MSYILSFYSRRTDILYIYFVLHFVPICHIFYHFTAVVPIFYISCCLNSYRYVICFILSFVPIFHLTILLFYSRRTDILYILLSRPNFVPICHMFYHFTNKSYQIMLSLTSYRYVIYFINLQPSYRYFKYIYIIYCRSYRYVISFLTLPD